MSASADLRETSFNEPSRGIPSNSANASPSLRVSKGRVSDGRFAGGVLNGVAVEERGASS